jgi:hypothetical protein
VIQPLLAVERMVELVPGAGPCQALAAEGGGRKARLYKRRARAGRNQAFIKKN